MRKFARSTANWLQRLRGSIQVGRCLDVRGPRARLHDRLHFTGQRSIVYIKTLKRMNTEWFTSHVLAALRILANDVHRFEGIDDIKLSQK